MTRILIIDDEPEILEALSDVFEHKGYNVDVALGGREGIEIYKENPADVVVLDIIMPIKDGYETINELKEKFSDVNIIAISGGGTVGPEKYLEVVRHYGVKYAFKKPIGYKELLAAVEDLCEKT